MKKILLATPPLVQPNTPYPATTTLAGYLSAKEGVEVAQADFSLELALRVFSKPGLAALAETARRRKTKGRAIRFFLENLPRYLDTVEPAITFLQGRDEAVGWLIARRGYLPEGPRFAELAPEGTGLDEEENLSSLFGDLGVVDRAKYLATLYLDDLSDAIREGVDASFGFARYADHLAVSAPRFDPILERLRAEPTVIDTMIDELAAAHLSAERPDFVGLTVPFPGTLYGALRIAAVARRLLPGAKILLGGGYVNSELRNLEDDRLFALVDYLCFDEGFAPLDGVLGFGPPVRTLTRENLADREAVLAQRGASPGFVKPSYAGLDLTRYFNVVETANPMHRIWSDGKWLKLQLANGCYWHRCAFCDLALDCISRYNPPPVSVILQTMRELKRETGLSGFHFTDEALSPALVRALSKEILASGETFTWWGNIRFEKNYDDELCRLMADAGCIAVTGGLECAHDRLLKLMNKGITLAGAASAMRSFSNAGILVHAYLMYGFPTETDEETIEALEFVRQRFAEGSLQSAFWHRFALTTHSGIVRDPDRFCIQVGETREDGKRFAENELPYTSGIRQSTEKLGRGLRLALYNYMMGLGLDIPVRRWFR